MTDTLLTTRGPKPLGMLPSVQMQHWDWVIDGRGVEIIFTWVEALPFSLHLTTYNDPEAPIMMHFSRTSLSSYTPEQICQWCATDPMVFLAELVL